MGDLTLEVLLDEKRNFDISTKFERLGVSDGTTKWSDAAPSVAKTVTSLPASSNILSVNVHPASDKLGYDRDLMRRRGILRLTSNRGPTTPTLFVSTADRRLHLLDVHTQALRASFIGLHDSPILSCVVFRESHLLSAAMSGQLVLSDTGGNVISSRRDHLKYVVKIATHEDGGLDPIVATAGWDGKVHLYRPQVGETVTLGAPFASITLPTKPEAMVIVRHPDNDQPLLLLSRADSSFLYYYTIEDEPRLLGRQNLAPNSNAWVAFTPSAIAVHPSDSSLVAVGLSTVPHMKVVIVRLLIPPYDKETVSSEPPARFRTSLLDDTPVSETQASQARAALAIADRESAAIIIHCNTMAPQTAYSTPAVVWRPDGSGIWCNGDDGAVRGIEASSGKVVSVLQGHEAGSKVRCLWAGSTMSNDGTEQELLVSGGFDQRLVVWTPGT